jgi:hypothetical protein
MSFLMNSGAMRTSLSAMANLFEPCGVDGEDVVKAVEQMLSCGLVEPFDPNTELASDGTKIGITRSERALCRTPQPHAGGPQAQRVARMAGRRAGPAGQDHYFQEISKLAAGGGFTGEKVTEISKKFDTNFPAAH